MAGTTTVDHEAITLVTTILNEGKSLPPFLESITLQTRRPDEVVVVDGGSTDDSVKILNKWALTSGIPTRIEVHPGAGISEGRNLGISQAQNEVIAVTDAGTRLDPYWLEFLASSLRADTDVVSGFFKPTGSRFFERTLAFAITPELREIDGEKFLPSSRSILFRRSAWASVGGYPEWLDYCEDLVFDLNMKARGLEFAFEPRAEVTWSARAGVRAYLKQYYRYARGDGKAGLWPKRHAIRYAAYAGGLVGVQVALRRPVIFLPLASGFFLYMRKFLVRSWHRADQHPSRADALRAMALVPGIVVLGDAAKLFGYPVGLVHRWRHTIPEVGQKTPSPPNP